MTTIAWDGTTLAADKLRTFGGSPVPTTKIFRCTYKGHPAILGCSGNAFEVERWKEWFLDGGDAAKKPKMDENFRSLLVLGEWKVFYASGEEDFIFVDVPMFATGSGASFAEGAMAFGATAEQAVKVASRFDIYTGSEVDTLTPKVNS